jgi:hypothetical protein
MRQAISNDPHSGSSLAQPIYFEAPLGDLWREIAEADFPMQPVRDRMLQRLEADWNRWLEVKALIDADFLREHRARVEAVKVEIDAAEQKTLIEEAEAKGEANFAADGAETQTFVDALYAHSQAKWRAAAEARLRRARPLLTCHFYQ